MTIGRRFAMTLTSSVGHDNWIGMVLCSFLAGQRARAMRMVVTCLVCFLCLLSPAAVLGEVAVSAPGGGGVLAGTPLVTPGVEALAGSGLQAAAEARRASPEAVAERAASRTRFEGLGRADAIALGGRTFGIERPSWTAPDSAGEGKITKYLSENTATEVSPSGKHLVLDSTVALRSAVGTGSLEPTSFTLTERDNAYVPANPLVPVAIAKSPAGGVSLPSEVSVAPTQAAAPEGSAVVGDRVLYPRTAPDTDFMVEPVPAGVETSWQLLSEDSPTVNGLRFSLPSGAYLQLSTSPAGGAEVVKEGQTLALIRPATATEADGTALPVSYSIAGSTLMTHVDLTGSVAFPVMVDPLIIANFGTYENADVWTGWQFANPCGCFGSEKSAGRLMAYANPGIESGAYGNWYIQAIGDAGINRVDVRGAGHSSGRESIFELGFNGDEGGEPIWTYNGYNGGEGNGTYATFEAMSGVAIAFCAQEGGGKEGQSPGLCNEVEGAQEFEMQLHPNNTLNNYTADEITAAVVRFSDSVKPNEVRLNGLPSTNNWVQYGPGTTHITAHDQGTGIEAFRVEIPPGYENEKHEVYELQEFDCNQSNGFDGCPQQQTGRNISFAGLSTGVHDLGVYAYDAAGNNREEEVGSANEEKQESHVYPTLYVDHTAPTIGTLGGSLAEANGGVIGSGDYALTFGAEDGSVSAPQSGVRSLTVFVDGQQVDQVASGCSDPVGVPASGCFALSGSWTMEGQKYGAGTHSIKVVAKDWVGNEASQSITVSENEAPSQSVGPGSVNLRTGAYTLQALDVSVPSAGGNLTVGRVYNSRALTAGVGGPLGPQWTLSMPDFAAGGVWQSLKAMPNGSVQATLTNDATVTFASSGAGYTSPTGYQTMTLSETSKSPLEYEMTDAAGDATIFKRASSSEEEAPLLIPSAAVQAAGTGGLNKMSYVFTKTAEGITEPKEEIAPYPSSINCLAELVRGCRALEFVYATTTTAEGEGQSQWKDYKGRLKEIILRAWNGKEVAKTPVAQYAWDSRGRLRAEWNPALSLKTIYGYDSEEHVTALTAPGTETWAFTYGTSSGDPNPGRLLKATQAPASAALWAGESTANTEKPALSGSAIEGVRMAVSPGKWSGSPVVDGYQWQDCNSSGGECTAIAGADNANYTPAPSDVGHTLVARVTATNGAGATTVATSRSAVVGDNRGEYSLPSSSKPFGITSGSDGNLWYTDSGTGKLGKITTTGGIAEYSAEATEPEGMTAGPDKNVWFVEHTVRDVGHITPAGAVTEYTLGRAGAGLVGIAAGPDENLWFTESETNYIGKLSTKDEVLGEYALPSGSKPYGIAVGPDKNLWFTDYGTSVIGKITTSGSITEYKLPAGSEPYGIVAGPDGNLWFTDYGTGEVGKITTEGAITEYKLPAGSGPKGITVGSDKNLWVAEYGTSKIAKITTAGAITETSLSAGSEPTAIVSGPDGSLWYTDYGTNKIGKLPTATITEAAQATPEPGATVEYNVPLAVAGRQSMTKEEVAKWNQGADDPSEATAIFPADEAEGWPAADYRRATIYYLDQYDHTVDVSLPSGAVSTAEYDSHGDTTRTLSADNRAAALKAGTKSAEAAKPLYTEGKYSAEGTELLETLGPEHKVKLPSGSEVQARKEVKYTYNEEGAPAGGPYRLATQTTEAALTAGKEEDKRTVTNSYSGQENLGWKLHEPTSTTTAANTLGLVHSALYSPTTGAELETSMPGSAAKEPAGLSYLRHFGSEGENLYTPASEAIDAHGNVWVTDWALGRIAEFSASGAFIKYYGSWGTGSDQFETPRGIAINPTTKNIYIGDEDNSRVEELNEKGEFIRTFGFGVSNGEAKLQTCTTGCKAGLPGAAAGQLSEPQGMAFDSSGNLWLTDFGENRIDEYTEKGEFVMAFGWGVANGESKLQTCTTTCKAGLAGSGNGELYAPAYLAFAGSNLYVSEYANNRVEEFNSTTKEYITKFASKGSGNGQLSSPQGIAVGAGGNIYVVDYANNRTEEFSSSGTYIGQFGVSGEAAGDLLKPEGIAIAPNGDIYVTDIGNKRIDEWTPSLSGNSGAYSSQTIYYTPKTEATVAACQNHPEWANLACQTRPAHQPEVEGTPPLPVTTFTYNMYDEPETTTSSSGEGSEEATRTETDEYDPAGRIIKKTTTSSTGTALPAITYTYGAGTGLQTEQSTGTGASEQKVTEEYNRLQQLAAYTDADGHTTSYEYEKTGDARLTKITDEKGSETLGYSETTGAVTSLKDSSAGTFTASYDPEQNIISETMPSGLTATTTRNQVGEPTGLEYVKETHCTENCKWFFDEVVPSIHGQWMSQTSTIGTDAYTYNEPGWLTQVQETPTGKGCATRIYGYDADANRTSLTRRPPATGGACASEGGEVEEHHYDTADRLIDAGATYNPFGDITTLSGSDAGGAELRSSFYTDGQTASHEQAGESIGYTLDPARRIAETVEIGHTTATTADQYDGPGTTPAWLAYATGEWTRNVLGISGSLDATQNDTETPQLQIANLHGDIIETVPDSETATKPSSAIETTEFGVPTVAEPPPHSWLGAYALRTELPSGVLALGARSYVPQLGRFLQPDPQPGGSANAYAYTRGDPLNETDLSGQWSLNETAGADNAVGSGEGTHGEDGGGVAPGAIMPAPPDVQAEEAFAADPPWDQVTAGAEEYEEYEEWEEEGEYEYASYRPHAENGNEEQRLESGVLYQSLPEAAVGAGEADSGNNSDVPLCEPVFHSSDHSCARDAMINRGGIRGSGCIIGCGGGGPHLHLRHSTPLGRVISQVWNEVWENRPKCYPNEIEGGGQCSSAPPGDGGDPYYPID